MRTYSVPARAARGPVFARAIQSRMVPDDADFCMQARNGVRCALCVRGGVGGGVCVFVVGGGVGGWLLASPACGVISRWGNLNG